MPVVADDGSLLVMTSKLIGHVTSSSSCTLALPILLHYIEYCIKVYILHSWTWLFDSQLSAAALLLKPIIYEHIMVFLCHLSMSTSSSYLSVIGSWKT